MGNCKNTTDKHNNTDLLSNNKKPVQSGYLAHNDETSKHNNTHTGEYGRIGGSKSLFTNIDPKCNRHKSLSRGAQYSESVIRSPSNINSSALIKKDEKTEETYKKLNFDPKTSSEVYNRTSCRVMKSVYNHYSRKTKKPKVFGYYTDWSQYDGRLDSLPDPKDAGRGRDLNSLDPLAYDKLIFGFLGIVGDQGEKAGKVAQAAKYLKKVQDEVVFMDLWGDIATWRNNGFTQAQWSAKQGWNIGENPDNPDAKPYLDFMNHASIEAGNSFGLLTGLYNFQQKAKSLGHTLELAFSVGGWTLSGPFTGLVKEKSRRETFIIPFPQYN